MTRTLRFSSLAPPLSLSMGSTIGRKMLLRVKEREIYSIYSYQKRSKNSFVQPNSEGGYLLIGVLVLYIDLMTPLFNY